MWMPARRKMLDSFDISRQLKVRRILRPGQRKFQLRQLSCRLAEKAIELRLPISGIRPHVAQITLITPVNSVFEILLRIERAIKRRHIPRPELRLQLGQHGASRKAEVDVQAGYLVGLQVIRSARTKVRQCNWSVDVVKSLDGSLRVQNLLHRLDSVGKVRSNHGYITILQLASSGRENSAPIFKNPHCAEIWFGQVAIRCVPFLVFLEKYDFMLAFMQGFG